MKTDISLLVADDHPMLLKGLVGALEDAGYKVLPGATNGAEALGAIMEQKPMIALLDIEMPILTGFEVIRKCREMEQETRFIILTSHKEKGFVHKAKKLNISGYLLSKNKNNDFAFAIIKLDTKIEMENLNKLKKMSELLEIKQVTI